MLNTLLNKLKTLSKKTKLFLIAAIIAVALLLSLSYTYFTLHKPASFPPELQENLASNTRAFIVKPGDSLHYVLTELAEKKILAHPHYLFFYAVLTGQNRTIKAGEYTFTSGTTPLQLLEKIVEGQVTQHILTIKEGWTFDQIMAVLNQNPYLVHELYGLEPGVIMVRLGYPGEYPEGMFYPDTYYFPRGMTDTAFLQRAYRLMQKKLETEWENRSPNLAYQSPYEALILASIIEKETGQANERPIIADLMLRRMHLGMRLQVDSTVTYAKGGNPFVKLKRSDLQFDSPYNTYRYPGLPPTPIAAPSLASIHAALQPEPNSFLYFVSNGNGTHAFSENLNQHNQAVGRYRKVQREQAASKLLP